MRVTSIELDSAICEILITLTHPPHNPPFTVLRVVSVIPVFLDGPILFIPA